MKDFEHAAAALYDGGWRSTDKEELQQEHGLTDEETAKIAAELEKIEANSAPAREGGKKMKQWNGTDASGRYQYPADQISAWNMTIDEGGTVYYIPHDGKNEPQIWCPASILTRHMHKLEQIAARR